MKEDEGKVSVFKPTAEFYKEYVKEAGKRIPTRAQVEKIWDRVNAMSFCKEKDDIIYDTFASMHVAEAHMPDELIAEAAKNADIAIITLSRFSAEGVDRKAIPGDYYLSNTEKSLIDRVTAAFPNTVIVLNSGAVVDCEYFAENEKVGAIIFGWQGGLEGGTATADIICGDVNPSGRLADTIPVSYDTYQNAQEFLTGFEHLDYFDDIYVGYRYFETVPGAAEKVRYPFGFGLSYTDFEFSGAFCGESDGKIVAAVTVRNVGKVPGKEVVELYYSAPQGKLGKAVRSLAAFAKTETLQPGESETLTLTFPIANLASYDDNGVTGHRFCYVLESGAYNVYTGGCVRGAKLSGSFEVKEDTVTRTCVQACAPVTKFDRMVNHNNTIAFEPAPQREYDMAARSAAALKPAKPYTGDKGIKLGDVFDGKAELEDFVAQLSDEDLICLMRGEGMNSPKVTAGTAGAFGGVTENLVNFGIPTACCADGPSGIRMDCGTIAFSLPNGTLLACTFNEKLNEELFAMQGKEQRKNRIDTLLGPGLNIHRSPLNGRNFEYFSEDPLLTGKLAAAQLRGMRRFGVTGTIKHFACNNQEFKRTEIDSVLSERALREIYLRAFETAVKEGGAYSVMSTYGGLNGIWTASNFDLLTTILRDEWGFIGTVMTDWWAKGNDREGEEATRENVAAQVRAQNDLNMVNADAASNSQHDNLDDALADGRLTRDALVRSAMNICRTVMNSPVMERSLGRMSDEEREAAEAEKTSEDYVDFNGEYQFIDGEAPLDISAVNTEKGASTILGIRYKKNGLYKFVMRVKANANEVAQIPMSIFIDGNLRGMVMINGTNGEVVTAEQDIGVLFGGTNYLKLYFGQTGMEIEEIKFVCTQAF